MAAELIDPFDSPQGAPAPQALPRMTQGGGMVDPFDDPSFNRPTGEVRNDPGPKRLPLGVSDSVEGSARLGTTARASLAVDSKDEIKRFAAARFPDMPLDQAVKRYGVVDGNIVYWDEKKNQYARETPSVWNAEGAGDFFKRAGQQIASGLGPAIPMTAGMTAGVLSAPLGGASAPIAGTAATVADLGRQALDRKLAGESPGDLDYMNAAGHGLMEGTGQAGGLFLNKAASRNPLGVAAYDKMAARSPQQITEAERLQQYAQSRGGTLSAGQATGLRSLMSKERQLSRFDETTDQMYRFRDAQREDQVPRIFNKEIDQVIAPKKDMEAAIGGFREGAEKTAETIVNQSLATGRQLYQKAFASGVEADISPLIQKIETEIASPNLSPNSPRRAALERILGDMSTVDAKGKRVPVGNMQALHEAKENLDSTIAGSVDSLSPEATSAAKKLKAEFQWVKNDLTEILKATSPEYQLGNEAYKQAFADVIEPMLNGGIGVLKRMSGPQRVAVVESIFSEGRLTPQQVGKMRSHYALAGKTDEWNDGLRVWLADRLTDARTVNAEGSPGNVPGKLHKSIRGNEDQWETLKAAVGDPGKVQAIESLMDYLKAASRSLPEGSPTTTDLAQQSTVGTGLKLIGKATSPGSWLNLGNDAVDLIAEMRTPAARIKLADALLSKDSAKELNKLRMLPNSVAKATPAVLNFAIAAGILPATGAREPSDFAAPVTKP